MEQPEEEEDVDIGDEDEMADFIVDEEVDEDGAPLRFFSSYILEPQTTSFSVLIYFITINHLFVHIKSQFINCLV